MFKKLFKKADAPTNMGETAEADTLGESFEVVAYITFPDLEGGVSEPITSKLTIGSEVGDFIIEDPSISPRHCTFLVSRDVVSVIDHASHEGTFINKKELDPGRSFFVHEKDKIKIGELGAKIEFKQVPVSSLPVPQSESLPPEEPEVESFSEVEEAHYEQPTNELTGEQLEEMVASDQTAELELSAPALQMADASTDDEIDAEIGDESDDIEIGELSTTRSEIKAKQVDFYEPDFDDDEDEEIVPQKSSWFSWRKKSKPDTEVKKAKPDKKTSKSKSKKIKVAKPPASFGVYRIFALLIDILFALSLHLVASPITEYKFFFDSVPAQLEAVLAPLFKTYGAVYYQQLIEQLPFIQSGVEQVSALPFFEEALSFFFLIITLRAISALVFKVSLGQALIGIREKQSRAVMGRLKGFVRELIGMFTVVWIIFDIGTLLNKRSFKEVLTFSRLTSAGPVLSTLCIVIWLPSALFCYLAAPLFKGFEFKYPVLIEETSSTRTKPWDYQKKVYSKTLDFHYDLASIKTLPLFEISQREGKKYRQFGLVFYDLKTGQVLEMLKVSEQVKIMKIVEDFVRDNPAAQFFKPKMYALAKTVENENFKSKIGKSDIVTLGVEFRSLVRNTFGLDLMKMTDFIAEEGVFFQGHVNFRERMEKLFDYPFQGITFSQFGKKAGLIFSHELGRERFYSYLPQDSLTPSIYRLSENVADPRKARAFASLRRGGSQKPVELTDAAAAYIDAVKFKQELKEPVQVKKQLVDRFREVIAFGLKNKNQKLISKLRQVISRNMSSLEIDQKNNSDMYRAFAEIQDNLNKKNLEFFGVEAELSDDQSGAVKEGAETSE